MKQSPSRRFTLADAMILTAASAAGFAFLRFHVMTWGDRKGYGYFDLWHESACCFLMPFSPALIWMRILKPRATRSRIVREPGIQANFAVIAAWIFEIFDRVADRLVHGRGRIDGNDDFRMIFDDLFAQEHAYKFVLFAWIGSWLGGRFRAEPSWIDRLGRGLGAFWVLGYVINMSFWYLVRRWG